MIENGGKYSNKLEKGMLVRVNPKDDRTRKILKEGKIKTVLTRSAQHTHGIMVELEDGLIGRVKEIVKISNVTEKTSDIDYKNINKITENQYLEFKSSALWSSNFRKKEFDDIKTKEINIFGKKASKFIIAKSIAGFLNTDGGTLVIGVKENKEKNKVEIIGIEGEFNKLGKDKTTDGYRRMIIDSIVKPYFRKNVFNRLNEFINIEFIDIYNKKLCEIKVYPSKERIFLRHNQNDYFFIRVDATTREIKGEEILDYCEKRFR
jgi:uncharacterized repeat protein (TIGR03833 family)